MSEKLGMNQMSITGPSFSTDTMHMSEIDESTSEVSQRCQHTTKTQTLDLQVKTENAVYHKDSAEDEINEDETNAVHESGRESGISSTGEIKQAKSEIKNDIHAEEKVNVTSNSSNEKKASTNENRKPDNVGTRSIGVSTVSGNTPSSDMKDALLELRIKEHDELVAAWSKLQIKEQKEEDKDGLAKKIGWFALKTAAMSGVILGGTALIVPALGFGAAGVTAGSLAAAYQSAFLGGTIASGSAFATLQSIGMAGLSAATNTAIVAGSAAASGVHSLSKNNKKGSK